MDRSNFLTRDLYIYNMVEEFNKLIDLSGGDDLVQDNIKGYVTEKEQDR